MPPDPERLERLGALWARFQEAPFPHRPIHPDLEPLYEDLLATEASLAGAIESLMAGVPLRRDHFEFPTKLLDRLIRIERSRQPGAREAAAYVEHLTAMRPLLAFARTLV